MANLLTGGLGDTGEAAPVVPDASPPTILTTRSPSDARKLDVYFSEPVVESEALEAANYSISPTLAVRGVTKLTDSVYRLTTDRQDVGQVYNVTASNIHDLAGNVI